MKTIKELRINGKEVRTLSSGGGIIYSKSMGYEELTYLESPNNAFKPYIDTEVYATDIDGFETRIEPMDINIGNWKYCLGSENNDFSIWTMNANGTYNNLQVRICGSRVLQYTQERVLSLHDGILRYGDEEMSVGAGSLGTSDNSIWLFWYNNANGFYGGTLQMHYVRFFSGDEMVADLHPARRLSDNALGMWDAVRKRFFENLGTGAFIAGEPTGTYF